MSGLATSCVNRRLGEARASFLKIQRVWKHAHVSKRRKVEIYMSCIVSKLLYSLECECLRAADRTRINGFHCRCLRTICKIPHSMISHITNAEVLTTAGVPLLTTLIDKKQLLLYGRVASQPHDSGMRAAVFHPGTVQPKLLQNSRRRGRPRISWIGIQHARALELAGGCQTDLNAIFLNNIEASKRWQCLVNDQFSGVTS